MQQHSEAIERVPTAVFWPVGMQSSRISTCVQHAQAWLSSQLSIKRLGSM